jgi:hypothetical protein
MSWQEELRRLDSELAAGTITSSEHRRRREDILAEVSGAPLAALARPAASTVSTTPAGPSPTTSEGSTSTAPASADTPEKPSEEPAEKPSDEPSDETAEATADTTSDGGTWQAANPAHTRPESDNDRPSTPSAAALLSTTRPTTAPSPADERPTELLRRIDFSTPPPGVPTADDESTDQRGRRTGLTWVAISGAVFLALGAVIGGAWWLGQDRSEPPPSGDGGSHIAAPGSTDDAPADEPALEDRVPALPGVPSPNDSTLAVDKGVELGLYPEQSAAILTDHGVNEVVHRASTDGDANYFLLVIPTPDAEQASSLASELRAMTVTAGFTDVEDIDGGLTGELGDRTLRGTWYASDSVAVNLWVSQPTPADDIELAAITTEVVEPLQEAFPPS